MKLRIVLYIALFSLGSVASHGNGLAQNQDPVPGGVDAEMTANMDMDNALKNNVLGQARKPELRATPGGRTSNVQTGYDGITGHEWCIRHPLYPGCVRWKSFSLKVPLPEKGE